MDPLLPAAKNPRLSEPVVGNDGRGSGSSAEAGSWRSMFTVSSPSELRPGEAGASFFAPPAPVRAFGFGHQQFRMDMDAPRDLSATTPTTFAFRVPRTFDLLTAADLVLTLPPIWSGIYPPCDATKWRWAPYELRWIDEIGAQIITEVRITAGNQQLAQYSGDYLATVAKRDYDAARYAAFREMIGDVAELTDPANALGRAHTYPSAFLADEADAVVGCAPSIEGRQIRVPIGAWFTHSSQAALPVVCLSESIDLTITVTLRPLQDWFRVRDVFDPDNDFPLCRPDFTSLPFQLHRFLQSPPQPDVSQPYANTTNYWHADVYIEATGSFLTRHERDLIAAKPQRYLVREVKTYRHDDVAGTALVNLESMGGMVASWTWHLSRSDVAARNEWANHSNWPYRDRPPVGLAAAPATAYMPNLQGQFGGNYYDYTTLGPRSNPRTLVDGASVNTGIYITGRATDANRKRILATNAVMLNGEFLETDLPASTWNQGLRYAASRNTRDDGLFVYSFALNPSAEATDQFSGGRDTSRISRVQLRMSVVPPPLSSEGQSQGVICDGSGNVIGVISGKPNGQFQYTYNVVVYEERWNFIEFSGGFAGLAVASS